MSRVALVGMPLLLVAAAAAGAQPAPGRAAFDAAVIVEMDVVAGAVATVFIEVPAPSGVSNGEYRLRSEDGVRVFGALSGNIVWTADSAAIVPVTLSVPRAAPAGTLSAATLTVRWPDGEWRARIAARVGARHALSATFEAPLVSIPRGEHRELTVRLHNDGNVSESVRAELVLPPGWTGAQPILAAPLEPGEAASLPVRIGVPAGAAIGESQAVVLRIAPEAQPVVATIRVVDPRGSDHGWVTLPGTAFIGAGDLGGGDAHRGLDAGLAVGGNVLPDTHFSLVWNRTASSWTGTALRRELAGPGLRAELRRPNGEVAAGDVYVLDTPLGGGLVRGVGASGSARLGALSADWLAARPGSADSGVLPGRVGWLRLGSPLGSGTAQLVISDLDQPDGMSRGRARATLAGYAYAPSPGHTLALDAGATAIETPDGRTETGPAAQGRYRYSSDAVHAEMRLRASPTTLPGSPTGTEAYAGAGGPIGRDLALSVWTLTNRSRARGGEDLEHSSSGLSFRYAGRGVHAHATTAASHTRGGAGLFGGSDQVALSTGLHVPIGALHVDIGAQLARVEARLAAGVTSLGSVRIGWYHGADWLAFSAVHQTTLFGPATAALDVAGARTLGALAVEGGLGLDLDARRGSERTRGWAALARELSPGSRLLVGADYQPWRAAGPPLRFSLGLRQTIAPPLPMRRRPVAYGVIFDDRNGNGRRDEGEPPLAGVDVRRGGALVASDEAGRFAFFDDAAQARLELDGGALPDNMLLPAATDLPARGRAEIGLVRTAELMLELVLDSLAMTPAPDGVRITIVHEAGTARAVTSAADGRARLPALLPGRHTLTVYPIASADHDGALQPTVLQLVIEPGESRSLTVVAPFRAREIRLRGGTGLPTGPARN